MLWRTAIVAAGMDHGGACAYITAMDIGTRLFTWLNGREVGTDGDGNVYFEDKHVRPGIRTRRWVRYVGAPEASKVPPEWHAWLHYTTDAPIKVTARAWQKPHLANATGTALGYRPQGHDYQGGQRAAATGDYEAWSPGAPDAVAGPTAGA